MGHGLVSLLPPPEKVGREKEREREREGVVVDFLLYHALQKGANESASTFGSSGTNDGILRTISIG